MLNKGVINHETYLFAGGGVVNYDWNYPEGSNQNSGSRVRWFLLQVRIGSKYFINEKLCINLRSATL